MGKHTKVRVAEAYPKLLLLSSLVISSFATQPLLIITGLLLIDIGLTFGHPRARSAYVLGRPFVSCLVKYVAGE